MTEAAQRMIEMAAELGAPLLRVFGGSLPGRAMHSTLLAPTAEVLHTICTYAARRNITVVLETHDAWSTSVDVLKGYFLLSTLRFMITYVTDLDPN